MSSLAKALDIVPEGQQTFTQRQASERLGIDQKTLLRRMQRIGERPHKDARDQRRSVFTEAQVAKLRDAFGIQDQQLGGSHRNGVFKSSPDASQAIMERITQMEKNIEASLESLRQQIAELNSALASVSMSLATTTKTVATLAQHVVEEDRARAGKRRLERP
jgi:hypothetical protein